MSVFHFKRFDVRNERSAMKVNTDGVLLGAATEVFQEDRHVLDIGTGTGTVALMIAQRLYDIKRMEGGMFKASTLTLRRLRKLPEISAFRHGEVILRPPMPVWQGSGRQIRIPVTISSSRIRHTTTTRFRLRRRGVTRHVTLATRKTRMG